MTGWDGSRPRSPVPESPVFIAPGQRLELSAAHSAGTGGFQGVRIHHRSPGMHNSAQMLGR